MRKFCECGCGQIAKKGNRYIWGHNRKGMHQTKTAKEKMSISKTGKPHYQKYWKPPSIKTRRKISKSLKKCWQNPVFRENQARKTRKSHQTKEFREHSKKLWQSSEFVKKMLKARQTKPNKAELKLNCILQQILPNEYALNVKADIMTLGCKIPDFVNVNGQKKLIELNGTYYHNPKYFPNVQSPEERISYFEKLGWNTLIIREDELDNRETLKVKLLKFSKL